MNPCFPSLIKNTNHHQTHASVFLVLVVSPDRWASIRKGIWHKIFARPNMRIINKISIPDSLRWRKRQRFVSVVCRHVQYQSNIMKNCLKSKKLEMQILHLHCWVKNYLWNDFYVRATLRYGFYCIHLLLKNWAIREECLLIKKF